MFQCVPWLLLCCLEELKPLKRLQESDRCHDKTGCHLYDDMCSSLVNTRKYYYDWATI
uniref:Uncharacterized protein n=1 Tax=Arundo donax TaxID=35708 RepID=A0A0A9HN56_ARUDO